MTVSAADVLSGELEFTSDQAIEARCGSGAAKEANGGAKLRETQVRIMTLFMKLCHVIIFICWPRPAYKNEWRVSR